jgi:hypothetical protein
MVKNIGVVLIWSVRIVIPHHPYYVAQRGQKNPSKQESELRSLSPEYQHTVVFLMICVINIRIS